MATKKVTITLDEVQVERIRVLVEAATDSSVSGFVQHVWPDSFSSRRPRSYLSTGLMPPMSDGYLLRVVHPMLWMLTL
jgi:hypothetical protein